MDSIKTHFDIALHMPLTPYTLPLILWDILEQAWAGRDLVFTEAWPRENVEKPTVVWSIYSRYPGSDGVEVIKPRYRGSFPTSDPSVIQEQYAQWQTIIYQFDIFGTTNDDVDALVDEFEDLMFHAAAPLQSFGADQWLFSEQLGDYELERASSQELYRRRLRYKAVLERKYIKSADVIRQIWIQSAATWDYIVNGVVTKGAQGSPDALPTGWVALPITVLSEPLPEGFESNLSDLVSSHPANVEDALLSLKTKLGVNSQYVYKVDFDIVVSLPEGQSYIVWLDNGIKPAEGSQYYVTYLYHNIGYKLFVKS